MKYKLIKEYPGSPKLNIIREYNENVWSDSNEFTSPIINPENYPEFWELVIEKDYEILSLKYIKNDNWLHDYKKGQIVECRLHNDGHLEFKTNKGSWDSYSQEKGFQKIMSEVFNIHSVKRLSDGEIFTIGDNVSAENHAPYTGGLFHQNKLSSENARGWAKDYYNTIISNFKFVENILCIMYSVSKNDTGQPINAVKKIKKPLFTTEDGVDIFEGDSGYILTSKYIINKVSNFRISDSKNSNKIFSTKEKAEEYIILNKPCLSYNEVLNAAGIRNENTFDTLKKLIKSKIQQSV